MRIFIVKFKDSFQPVQITAYSLYAAKQKARLFHKGRKVEYISEQVQYA